MGTLVLESIECMCTLLLKKKKNYKTRKANVFFYINKITFHILNNYGKLLILVLTNVSRA